MALFVGYSVLLFHTEISVMRGLEIDWRGNSARVFRENSNESNSEFLAFLQLIFFRENFVGSYSRRREKFLSESWEVSPHIEINDPWPTAAHATNKCILWFLLVSRWFGSLRGKAFCVNGFSRAFHCVELTANLPHFFSIDWVMQKPGSDLLKGFPAARKVVAIRTKIELFQPTRDSIVININLRNHFCIISYRSRKTILISLAFSSSAGVPRRSQLWYMISSNPLNSRAFYIRQKFAMVFLRPVDFHCILCWTSSKASHIWVMKIFSDDLGNSSRMQISHNHPQWFKAVIKRELCLLQMEQILDSVSPFRHFSISNSRSSWNPPEV